jgi:hypothetical protein
VSTRAERRKGQRVEFERPIDCCMMAIDGTWRHDYKMQDVSETGARLTVEGSIEGLIIKEFFLLLSPLRTIMGEWRSIGRDFREAGFQSDQTLRNGSFVAGSERLGRDIICGDSRISNSSFVSTSMLGRTADLILQIVQFQEGIGLSSQFIGYHRRLRSQG